jgi:hypothetical protein
MKTQKTQNIHHNRKKGEQSEGMTPLASRPYSNAGDTDEMTVK